MTRLMATGASLLPSFPQTLEAEGYSANLRQRMVPWYRRASTFGTVANALDGSVSVAKAVIGNDRLEFKDKIEPHQSSAQFNKAMMGNDPIELEIKPHHSGDAVQ